MIALADQENTQVIILQGEGYGLKDSSRLLADLENEYGLPGHLGSHPVTYNTMGGYMEDNGIEGPGEDARRLKNLVEHLKAPEETVSKLEKLMGKKPKKPLQFLLAVDEVKMSTEDYRELCKSFEKISNVQLLACMRPSGAPLPLSLVQSPLPNCQVEVLEQTYRLSSGVRKFGGFFMLNLEGWANVGAPESEEFLPAVPAGEMAVTWFSVKDEEGLGRVLTRVRGATQGEGTTFLDFGGEGRDEREKLCKDHGESHSYIT